MVGGPVERKATAEPGCRGSRKAAQGPTALNFNPKLVYEGDYRIDSGHRAGLSLLPHRPDAVFCGKIFLMTVGFMQAAQEMGYAGVLKIFGLVTLDDYPWLRLFDPPLTAMELPKYEVGCMADRTSSRQD